MSLLEELKRRNVLRVAAAYIAVAWLLIQVAETLFPVFGLSDAAIRAVVIALAIGFVPAVIVAWAFELTADGLVRESDVDRGSVSAKASTKHLDRIVMVALALAVGFFAFDKFMLDPARDQAIAEAAKEEGRVEALQASRDAGPPVLAVLPFWAVTDTTDSVFFAAGVHDDLLTKLAQLPSMVVISRTSVLEYKDVERNMRQIGEALGADAILEGGVQSAGNRIRINAQLIDAATDEHLWAETYDRELTTENIFDVQDDIARSIAEALHVTLGEPAENSLIPTSNMAAYRAYHEAVTVRVESHGGTTSDEYRALLRKAFELDPAFTKPMALLVGSLTLEAFGGDSPELVTEAEELLELLQDIAPGSADYLIAQTYYAYYVLKDYELALQLATQALELVPNDAYLVSVTGWIKRRQGDYEGNLEAVRLARQLDPGNGSWTEIIIQNLFRMHRYEEAAAELEDLEEPSYFIDLFSLFLAVREHRDFDRLAKEVEALAERKGDANSAYDVWWARALSRDYEGLTEAVAKIPKREEHDSPPRMGISMDQGLAIWTAWILGDDDTQAKLVAEARDRISQMGTPDELLEKDAALGLALLAGIEGKTEEAERLVQAWYQGGAKDLAGRTFHWSYACEALGMAGAAEAAVDCIRKGLEYPTGIAPFIEPYAPFYDPIRDEPVFVELLEELEEAGR